jgi:hypothetical protein
MNAAQPDWVQQSLARLEQLEAQREQLEAAGQIDRLAELDEEIASLYEVLETVAEDDDAGAANVGAAAPMHAAPQWAPQAAPMAAPAAALAAPVPGPFDAPAPYSAPMMEAPVSVAPPAAFGGESFSSYDDGDDAPRSSKAPLVILGLLVIVGAGVGVAMTMGTKEEAPPPAEPAGPAKVISSSEIPEDTQEPKAAQGLDVDQSEGTRFKESAKGAEPAKRPSSGSSRPSSRPSSKSSSSDDRSIKFDKSKDPLGGV